MYTFFSFRGRQTQDQNKNRTGMWYCLTRQKRCKGKTGTNAAPSNSTALILKILLLIHFLSPHL